MQNITKCFSALLFALCFFFNNLAISAPLKTAASLPLTGADIVIAQERLLSKEATEQFIYFIKSLDVFPDHENPIDIADQNDRSIRKKFFIMPFFQASEERAYVGGQELADYGIKIIADTYDLLEAFDFELLKINQLIAEKTKKLSALDKLRKKLLITNEPLALQSLERLISEIDNEIANIDRTMTMLENRAARGLNETSSVLRAQVLSQVELKLAFLGITATNEERILLNSDDANQNRRGIASLVARASFGQFGYRNAIYEAGYNKQQRDWIALYRALRPDVSVGLLPVNVVYARSTALTAKINNEGDYDYFLGKDQVVNAPRLFLAVNGGSNGVCGNTKTCNVILEYTWLGATMAKTARSGAVAMPIYFEADVSFMQPEFEGKVSCDFTHGFFAQGRADVKDGAVIYDGDVTNKINYSSSEEGGCRYQIVKGDAESAAYHTIKTIYDNYMLLKMQRAAKSREEMNRYREYVNNELAYHAAKSQNTNFEFWSLSTWTTALGSVWGPVVSFVVGSARSLYWHTRIEDSSTNESVKFETSINESNVLKTERMAFDGFTMLCWKKDGPLTVLSACPSTSSQNYGAQADTDLGKNQQFCGDEGTSASCLELADDEADNASVDENGVIEPWA